MSAVERSHYVQILAFIYRNRFALACQVRRRFSHLLKSERTTRRHLAEMERLGYLATADSRSLTPLFPKTFCLTARGARRLREWLAASGRPGSVGKQDRRRREGFSSDHILHEVLTTELLLDVWQATQTRSDLELLTIQRRSIDRVAAFAMGKSRQADGVRPDCLFVVRQQKTGMTCFLVELDRGTMSPRQLRRKFARYDAWARSDRGQRYLSSVYQRFGATNPRPFFRLLLIACSGDSRRERRRLGQVARAAQRYETRRRLWITSGTQVATSSNSDIFGAAIWYRADELIHGSDNQVTIPKGWPLGQSE